MGARGAHALKPVTRTLPRIATPERAWLEARWAAVCRRVAEAPPPWSAWAREQLGADGVGEGLREALGWEPAPGIGGRTVALDRARDPRTRTALGQVFTPEPVADLMARMAGIGEDEPQEPMVLDPACGAGSLLLAALDARRRAGWTTADALAHAEGWDRDPVAAWSCRAALVEWALRAPEGRVPGDLRVFTVDALGEGPPARLRDREPPYARGVGLVLSNPPYLESKRMDRVAPGLKERLRARFPELRGAFDLYLAFCWAALDWTAEGGRMVLLLPNKVLQGRYAAGFRRRILDGGALVGLADLSRAKPRPFPGTGVYPVVLRLDRGAPRTRFAARRFTRASELSEPVAHWPHASVEALRRVGGDHPIFAPFGETWPDLEPLLALPRFEDVAVAVSTCSFHARGLRERFVGPERPETHAFPYLGGPSRARRTEVAPFRIRWEGWWIRYDQEALKVRHGNPLPDLRRTFLRPKAIFCQHATRLRVWADFEGRWVTKDVYPVAWPVAPGWSLGKLVAVLQSTVFTALYNTFYQGVVCGGETYHYLPAFLRRVPVPRGDHPALEGVEALVERLQEGEGEVDPVLWDRLDRAVAEAYGVDEAARRRMIEVHLLRVGAEAPPVANQQLSPPSTTKTCPVT